MNLQQAKDLIQEHPGQFYTYILKRPDGRPFYVGKGNCKGFRIAQHEKEAKTNKAKTNKAKNRHKINTIRRIWNERKIVDYDIVLFADKEEDAFDKEIELINLYKRTLVNITDGGEGVVGLIHSEATRKKFSDRMVGNTNTKGICPSEETRKKMSESHIGKSSWNKGIPHTNEEKRKISAKLKGRVSNRKGAILTIDQKQKISKSLKGRIVSLETRRKLSKSTKAVWGRRKEVQDAKKSGI